MNNISILDLQEGELAHRLNRLSDPPKLLYCRGRLKTQGPTVAIVGSRKCSTYGKYAAQKIAVDLAMAEVSIVSGLALGIDSHAHRTAVAAGGHTVAVLPSGLDLVYPAAHRNLAEEIIRSGGTLISEYPNGTKAQSYFFVARNRLIAALADAVVVVEAATKSGTLITAEFALDMGIPVLAVPGPINSPTSMGTNRLIQSGARLVASAEDIAQEIGFTLSSKPVAVAADNPEQADILRELTSGAKSFSDLANSCQLETRELSRQLTHLELNGSIKPAGNNYWVLS